MEIKKDYVLILGSKPDAFIPKINFKYIYAANGAIEIANKFKKENEFSSEIISVVTTPEFLRNFEVQKRVLSASPKVLISRFGKIDVVKFNINKNLIYKNLSNLEQLKIQSKFFKYGIFDIFFKETYYEEDFIKKVRHMFFSITNNRLIGVSTGFFSILYALSRNKDCKIVISGIGMSAGGHFYNLSSDRYSNRSRVDKKLLLSLKNIYKQNLMTTDKQLSENGQINLWS